MQTIETPDEIIENLEKAKEIIEDIKKHLDRDIEEHDNLYDNLKISTGNIEEAESIVDACVITLKYVKPEPKPEPLGFCEYRGCVQGKDGCFCCGHEDSPCNTNPDTPGCYIWPTKEVGERNIKLNDVKDKLDDLLKELNESRFVDVAKKYLQDKLEEMKAIIMK